MACDIDPGRLRCRVCGTVVSSAGVKRNCGKPPPGLGDMVAAGLSAVGITKERVSAVLGRDCGCEGTQEALNAAGRRFGIG